LALLTMGAAASLFSLVPFACFVVLAGNTVASASTEDLSLLHAALAAIEPIAAGSASGKKIVDVCRALCGVAGCAAARPRRGLPTGPPLGGLARQGSAPREGQPADAALAGPAGDGAGQSHEHPMAPQDWDAIMGEFELGTGAGALASLVEPYISFEWGSSVEQGK
jgi:hypothetical protein